MEVKELGVGTSVCIMGVINATPDSFYANSRVAGVRAAVEKALIMAKQGACIIDIGGESSRPGFTPVDVNEELRRVIPVIENIKASLEDQKEKVVISVDTTKALVAKAALKAGAGIINDVSGLEKAPDICDIASENGSGFVIMHGREASEIDRTRDGFISIDAIVAFLEKKVKLAISRGIRADRIIVDPGIGFGKTKEENLAIIKSLARLKELSKPILLGVSRKSFLSFEDQATDKPEGRLLGSLAATAIGVLNGADIIRTHDVAETKAVVKAAEAMMQV